MCLGLRLHGWRTRHLINTHFGADSVVFYNYDLRIYKSSNFIISYPVFWLVHELG